MDLFSGKDISNSDLELIFKYGKPKNNIGKFQSKPFIELPYGLVKIEIPNLIRDNNFQEAVCKIFSVQFPEFEWLDNISANDVVAFILWIKEQLEFISDIEHKYLHTEPKPELLASGINRLEEFGVMATIDNLAGGDILKYEQIEALPYYKVYQKLKLDKIQSEIKERYEKILINKAKKR